MDIVSRFTESVTDRVNAKSGLINKDNSSADGDEEGGKRMSCERPNQDRQNQPGSKSPKGVKLVLVHDETAFLEVFRIAEIDSVCPKKHPAYVGVKKAFFDIV